MGFMTKICPKCKLEKTFNEFYKSKNTKNGLHSQCIECKKVYLRQNAEKIKQQRKEYRRVNNNKIKQQDKEYRKLNVDKIKRLSKEYSKKNRNKIKEYRKLNANKMKKYKTEYDKKLRNCNLLYKFKSNIRALIRGSFKRNKMKNFKKTTKTETLLGCTISQLYEHLEKQFQEGMTWENHGRHGWHIDHRIPLASATTQEEVEKLCHYTNLQPLWAIDNLKKRDKQNGWSL
jgi:hypothetical protein